MLTSKPWRSAHRTYIRMSISAQSCDSVPPAPGWMVEQRVLLVVRTLQHRLELERLAPPAPASAVSFSSSASISGVRLVLDQLRQLPRALEPLPQVTRRA